MNPLVKNPQTGYLESVSPASATFDAYKKSLFLQIVHEMLDAKEYPDIDMVCRQIGIDIRSFYRHLVTDSIFSSEWHAVKLRINSIWTRKLSIKADAANGTLANLAILRHNETGRWGDDRLNPANDLSHAKTVENAVIIDVDPEVDVNASQSTTNINDNSRVSA